MSLLSKIWKPAASAPQKASTTVVTPATPAAPAAPAPKQSVFEKIWTWIKGEVTHVETGISDLFGSDAAAKIEAAGKALLESNFGPLITTALADATNVATGQMSVSKAISSLISQFEAEGKTLSQAAALQIIGVAQNSLPVALSGSNTVTPTS